MLVVVDTQKNTGGKQIYVKLLLLENGNACLENIFSVAESFAFDIRFCTVAKKRVFKFLCDKIAWTSNEKSIKVRLCELSHKQKVKKYSKLP